MFGFGEKTGIDLSGERAGLLPSSDYYDERYGENRWTKGYLVSLAIGQGELGTTPVQLAVYAAALANNGILFQPHIVNGYRDTGTGKYIPFTYAKQQLPVSQTTFNLIHDGMRGVVLQGTGTLANVPGVTVAGKTGTAQNPHGKDHAWFIAFAPVENPKIALAVLVENAGFGGAISAPIARELIKYYIKGGAIPASSASQRIKHSEAAAEQPGPTESTLPDVPPEKPVKGAEPAAEATIENNTGKAVK